MQPLASLRCNHHASREAAALCARCQRPYCRECVTEHEGRVLCTSCLGLPAASSKRRWRLGPVLLSGGVLCASLASLILLFVLLGKALLSLPSEQFQNHIWPPESAK